MGNKGGNLEAIMRTCITLNSVAMPVPLAWAQLPAAESPSHGFPVARRELVDNLSKLIGYEFKDGTLPTLVYVGTVPLTSPRPCYLSLPYGYSPESRQRSHLMRSIELPFSDWQCTISVRNTYSMLRCGQTANRSTARRCRSVYCHPGQRSKHGSRSIDEMEGE